jgi:hypothetical protein|tara:strand:+ start:605 stop:1033 length:429 start_codon:yes stop_codon:yes gene_type:complete
MIKYKLICKYCTNTFDSWFSSSREYEKLKKQGYINCHICNSLSVEKTLMSPSILKSQKNHMLEVKKDKYKKIKKTIDEYQKFIKKNFEYVGENFAYEARSIHYKNTKKVKGIYGSASKEEIKELSEEGIEAEVIPWLEDKSN